MNYDAWSSLTEMFFAQASQLGEQPFLWSKAKGGDYQPKSWGETAAEVRDLARG